MFGNKAVEAKAMDDAVNQAQQAEGSSPMFGVLRLLIIGRTLFVPGLSIYLSIHLSITAVGTDMSIHA